MKNDTIKAVTVVLAVYIVLFVGWCIATAPNGDRAVYTTRNGECYHAAGCSSLKYNKFKTTIEEAVNEGYGRCDNCDPPELITGEGKMEFSVDFVFSIIFASFALSIMVWAPTVTLFHFFDIPVDEIPMIWYPISAAVFLMLVLFT